ncbi:MAG: hypothetical protein ACOY90_20310 [Candidatus Zhuqueibacterota bacterium]
MLPGENFQILFTPYKIRPVSFHRIPFNFIELVTYQYKILSHEIWKSPVSTQIKFRTTNFSLIQLIANLLTNYILQKFAEKKLAQPLNEPDANIADK